ncbi:MAG: DUF4350 domain-containing protein [Burkholderiales bacterium]
MSRQQVLVWLLILSIAASGVAWWYANWELRTEPEEVGFQGRARSNPWLSAERLLEHSGAKVKDVTVPSDLLTLPENGIVILPKNRHALTPAARESVLAWLKLGGFLIVEAEDALQPDPLLDRLGVSRTMHDKEGKKTRASRSFDLGKSKYTAQINNDAEPLAVELQSALALDSENFLAKIEGERGAAGILIEYGAGSAMVLNDLEWMSRDAIRDYQHADFLWQLARPDPPASEVVVFNSPQSLSLLHWLREHAWTAVAGTALALALWLWRSLPRLGPIAPDPPRARRRLLDHLRASGRFLWANGGAQTLLDSARDAALKRLARIHLDLSSVDPAEHERRVSELLGLDAAQVRALRSPMSAKKPVEFLRHIGLYQSVHDKLSVKKPASRNHKRTT